MYKKISDYGIIGNLHSAALISLDGSIDWLCLPHLDSSSIFGALLDDRIGGRFAVTPSQEWDSTADYLKDTNVLVTRFRTRSGIARMTDFMPVVRERGEMEESEHVLYRFLEVERGSIEMEIVFEPRFDYGRNGAILKYHPEGGLVARHGRTSISLSSTRPVAISGGKGEAVWKMAEGDEACLHIRYNSEVPDVIDIDKTREALQKTVDFWRNWLYRSEAGRLANLDTHRDQVNRSLLTLKLLFYSPLGSIAAAVTTSLPEEIGGVRNWDYRFSWVRDSAMTLEVLLKLGHASETEDYLRWLERIIAGRGKSGLKVMYGLRGNQPLPEQELSHLDGYKASQPARIGNAAANQKQFGIYGHLMQAVYLLSQIRGGLSDDLWDNVRGFCDYVAGHWREKDSSIWEMRGEPRHFVHSKIMCWVAMDRGLRLAVMFNKSAEVGRWETVRTEIRHEVLTKGWSGSLRAFVLSYDGEELDASHLLIPMVGFLPFDDPRVVSTVDAIRKHLSQGDFLYRYRCNDSLPGQEGVFLYCTFWLITNLARQGKVAEAEYLFHKAERAANHLGLFSEEYDPQWREQLGNFPQAFSHIGHLSALIALSEAGTH